MGLVSVTLYGCGAEQELSVIASSVTDGTYVAAVHSRAGAHVWAGGSLYSFEGGELSEVVTFSDDHALTGIGLNGQSARSGGALQIGDDQVVMVRTVRQAGEGTVSPDGEAIVHHEVVVSGLERGEGTEARFATPLVMDVVTLRDETSVSLVTLCADTASARYWITVESSNVGGSLKHAWTREIRGTPFAWATRQGASGSSVGLVTARPQGSGYELVTFDMNGTEHVFALEELAEDLPRSIFTYDDGTRERWLIMSVRDEGNTLLLSDGVTSVDVSGDRDQNAHSEVMATGDLLLGSAGDELVMNLGRADRGTRRAAVVTLVDGEPRVLQDLGVSSIGYARIADMDGDGNHDLVSIEYVPEPQVVSHRSPERVVVRLSNGSEFSKALASATYTSGVESVDVGDLDGDGLLEVIVGYEDVSAGAVARVDVLALR